MTARRRSTARSSSRTATPMAGKTPKVVAGAYTNSANPKPTATALYDIDATRLAAVAGAAERRRPQHDRLARHQAQRRRSRSTSSAKGEDNAAWLVTGGMLYSVDLKTGKATIGRQARRRDRQAHRHRLDRLSRADPEQWIPVRDQSGITARARCAPTAGPMMRAVRKCPPQGWTAASKDPRPAAPRSGPLRLRRGAMRQAIAFLKFSAALSQFTTFHQALR